MNAHELLALKHALLDDIHELATEPVADPEPVKRKIEELFQRLEQTHGETTRKTG
jgi:hypothetical protein